MIDYTLIPFTHEPTEHVCPCGGRLDRSTDRSTRSRLLVCVVCGADRYEVAA